MCDHAGVTDTLSIDLWSDVICPFCYLGSRRLALAIDDFEHAEAIEVRVHAFELDAHSSVAPGTSLEDLVAAKYQMPVEKVQRLHQRLEDEARGLGLEWSLARAQPTNTFDAHRLIALATSQDRGEAMTQRLFRAYFAEGVLVCDRDRLDVLAEEMGVEGASELWRGEDFTDEVRHDEASALELGISGVPAFLIDSKFMVLGAQEPEAITDVLRRAWARRAA